MVDQYKWHERVEDRVRQCEVLEEFCEGKEGRSALVLVGQPWDAILFEGGKSVGLVEVKCRRHVFGFYPDYTIDCKKMETIWERARSGGLATILLVSWEDGLRWARVERGVYKVSEQKRRDRDEFADKVFHVPLTQFRPI